MSKWWISFDLVLCQLSRDKESMKERKGGGVEEQTWHERAKIRDTVMEGREPDWEKEGTIDFQSNIPQMIFASHSRNLDCRMGNTEQEWIWWIEGENLRWPKLDNDLSGS